MTIAFTEAPLDRMWRSMISWRRWLLGIGLALAGVLLMQAPGNAGVLDVSWTAPMTNTDESRLTDLASYRVYYGVTTSPCGGPSFLQVVAPTATPSPNEAVSARLRGLVTGTRYYVAVSAVSITGNESDCSPRADAVARDDFAEGPIDLNVAPASGHAVVAKGPILNVAPTSGHVVAAEGPILNVPPASEHAVAAKGSTLNVPPASVPARGSVTATWNGITAPTPTDWIGLYAEGTAGGAYLAWIYVSCSQMPGPAKASGSCILQIPPIAPPGRYEFRLYAANMFTRLTTSSPFIVTHRHRRAAPASGPPSAEPQERRRATQAQASVPDRQSNDTNDPRAVIDWLLNR